MSKTTDPSGDVTWRFPIAGWDTSAAFSRQPNRNVGPGKSDYARTAAVGLNVRGYEPGTLRGRGGSRSGLTKFIPVQVNGEEWVVQDLNILVEGASMQTSQSGRVVVLVAVSAGNVRTAQAGDTTWTTPANNTGETPPLNITGLMQSAANGQILYFADGVNWVKYVPATNSLETWSASAGTLPEDEENNLPRIICTWRGRTVLSGLIKDPQNWFMSAVNDPTDFDYSPLSPSPTQAVAGNSAPMGLIGDVVTGLCPYSDDILVCFCDHEIHLMRGDPMAGGQIDQLTNVIGAAFGRAWCIDPWGTIYWFSNRGGIYSMVLGNRPQRISQAIENFVQNLDTGTNSIRLIWNDRQQGFHTFITPLNAPTATTHLFWEARSGGWWQDEFAVDAHNPLCCATWDGNAPGDRVVLAGCWDGYVRAFTPTATKDDGHDIASQVVIGPLTSQQLDDMMIYEGQAEMGAESGTVTYEVFIGQTAEEALSSSAVVTGTFGAGRSPNQLIRRAAHALYIKISASNPWAMERFRLRVAAQGKIRRREAPI